MISVGVAFSRRWEEQGPVCIQNILLIKKFVTRVGLSLFHICYLDVQLFFYFCILFITTFSSSFEDVDLIYFEGEET